MVQELLNCIIHSRTHREVKDIAALTELKTILEKLEIGLEAISKEDTEWNYSGQILEVQQNIKRIGALIEAFKIN